jgi:hypothetical protein
MLLSMHGAHFKGWAMQSILQKWRVYWGVNHERLTSTPCGIDTQVQLTYIKKLLHK